MPNQIKGYFSSKYVDPDFIGERTSARPYLIRFSDIALVYAEAVGPEEGLAYVNHIRERAGITPLSAGMSLDDFRNPEHKARIIVRSQTGKQVLWTVYLKPYDPFYIVHAAE